MENSTVNVPITRRYDYTIWMGDFNSRIDDNTLSPDNIHQRNFLDLLSRDQWMLTSNIDQTLRAFEEGMITFPPTYKLEHNKPGFMDGKEWRIPGWCDRILFHKNDNPIRQGDNRIEQIVPA